MTLGDPDCCAKCGHGEIWHPTCCGRKEHRFITPLIVEGKTLIIGDKFYYNFEGDKAFPKDPKGWILSSFSGSDGRYGIVVKPKGFEKFIIDRRDSLRFRLDWGTKA